MREKKLTLVAVALVGLGMLTYLVVYSVRVDQVAAHYRFGKVMRIIRPSVYGAEGELEAAEGVKVYNRAGWFFRLPWPFDKVTPYDQRVRHLDTEMTQFQLPDGNQVMPRVYVTWRIEDPVAFLETLQGDEKTAERRLKGIIGNRTSVVFGGHNLDDVVNTDKDKLKFDDIERQILQGVKDELDGMDKPYGVKICSLGITWIALPEETTSAVFRRMEKERERLAEALSADGDRIKRTKIAEATEEQNRILAEAEAKAKGIRADAEAEAALYYETFARNESLAVFLRRLEALRRIATNASKGEQPLTVVLSTKVPPFDVLESGPHTDDTTEEIVVPGVVGSEATAALTQGEGE